jgi:hypothetical protein
MQKQLAKALAFLAMVILLPALSVAADAITRDLGIRNVSFGSTGQAAAMLSLLNDKPHQRKYQLSYKTKADTVFFQFDMAMDTITRVHKRKNGTGTIERWQGDALYRLQAAAKGGSLNDTKEGKSSGTLSNF